MGILTARLHGLVKEVTLLKTYTRNTHSLFSRSLLRSVLNKQPKLQGMLAFSYDSRLNAITRSLSQLCYIGSRQKYQRM
jgi:hypothetical protein